MYSPVPLPSFTPGSHGTEELERGVREWVFSPPLRDLVTLFGGELRAAETRAALSWLDDFSHRFWDFRRGSERAAVAAQAFDPEPSVRIGQAVEALGLIGRGRPSRPRYDKVLVLGGGALGCLIRADFAATLIAGGLSVGGIAGLGSSRPLSTAEAALVRGPAETEGDALDSGLRSSFGLGDEPPHRREVRAGPVVRAEVRAYPPVGGAALEVVVASRVDPPLRPNTADTYAAWSAAAGPLEGADILIVTTQIYVPFQQCDAILVLGRPLNCTVETIGAPAEHTLPDGGRQDFGTAQYLQEVRSAVRSMRRLLAAYDGDPELAGSR